MNKTRLRCPVCRTNVSLNEQVDVDIFNTITHTSCNSEFEKKNHGSLGEMIDQYPFFESILDTID